MTTTNSYNFDINAGREGVGEPMTFFDIITLEMSRHEALELVERLIANMIYVKDETIRIQINGKLSAPFVLDWATADDLQNGSEDEL